MTYFYIKILNTLHIIVAIDDNLEHELQVKVPTHKNIQFKAINCENKIKFNSFYTVDIKVILGDFVKEPEKEKLSLTFVVDKVQELLKCNLYYDNSSSILEKDFSKIPFFYYNKVKNNLEQIKDKNSIKEETIIYTPFFPYIVDKTRINLIKFNKMDLVNINDDMIICINKKTKKLI